MLLLGIALGALAGISCMLEPLLASVGILVAILLGGQLGVGFALAFLCVSSVTKYISTIGNDSKLTQKGKARSVAFKAVSLHYASSTIVLGIGLIIALIINSTKLMPPGMFMMGFSIAVVLIPWIYYIFKDNTKRVQKIAIVGLLAIAGWVAITTQGSRGTLILFTSLFSLGGALTSLKSEDKRIPVQKDITIEANNLPIGMGIFAGLLSSTVIGFPGAAVEKLILGKKISVKSRNGKVKIKNKDNEVYETLLGAVSSGIQTGLGIFLFLLESVQRDNFSTVLSVLFKGVTITHLQVVILIFMIIILSTVAKNLFDQLSNLYISYNNFKYDAKLGYASKVFNVCFIFGFIILASYATLPVLAGLVGLCLGIQWLISKLKLDKEIVGIVTALLPLQSVLGLV